MNVRLTPAQEKALDVLVDAPSPLDEAYVCRVSGAKPASLYGLVRRGLADRCEGSHHLMRASAAGREHALRRRELRKKAANG